MPWRLELSITGPRHSQGSSKIRPSGTRGRGVLTPRSIQSSFRVRCTAWRPICTRFSCRLRVPVRPVPASAVEAVEEVSLAEALGAGAEACFERTLLARNDRTANLTPHLLEVNFSGNQRACLDR